MARDDRGCDDRLGSSTGRIWTDPGVCRIDPISNGSPLHNGLPGIEHWATGCGRGGFFIDGNHRSRSVALFEVVGRGSSALIELASVTIRAGDYMLPTISFTVESGQYAVIMGRTGIGKTTILEAICGLRALESGRIIIDGIDVTNWSPKDRNLGYVPQDLALFPTLNVREHLDFAQQLRGVSAKTRKERSEELAELLGISHLLARSIVGLSGGEAQRVALGRALSFRPRGLLLDEPLSALDRDTRDIARNLLKNLNRETGVTVLHVTHNDSEATALADSCLRLECDEQSNQVRLNIA
jgi:ABC-type sugar transport system ATPase subunit